MEYSVRRMIFNAEEARQKVGYEHCDAACTVYKKLNSPQHRHECGDAAGTGADALAAQMQKGLHKAPLEIANACDSTQKNCPPSDFAAAYHQSNDSKTPRDGHSSTTSFAHSLSDDAGQVESVTHAPNHVCLQKVLQITDATVGGSSSASAASESAEGDEASGEGEDDASTSPAAAAHPAIMQPGSDHDACSVFFARVPPTVPYDSILALFQHFGIVKSLNLFRPWASAKTSKGCGIVEYEEAPAALAAMSALHTKYHWTGGETTMVVEWMDPARHRKDRQGSLHDGSKQASRSSSSAPKFSKNSCKKNGKQSLRPCSNLNSVPLPSSMGGSWRVMPCAGLASSMSAAYAPQCPWIMDVAAKQAYCNTLDAAAAGIGSVQGLEQVHMDGLIDGGFNVASGSLPAQVVPIIAPCWGSGVGMAIPPTGMCSMSSTSQDGSCHSWPLSEPPPTIPPNAVQAAAADSARVANLLLQQQRQAALGSLVAQPASVGSHYGCTSHGDLQMVLENLKTQSYMAGIGGLGVSGDAATTASGAAATAAAATGVSYHAAQLMHADRQVLCSSGSPSPSNTTLLFNRKGSFSAPNSSAAAAAAAAAASLLAASNDNSLADVYSSSASLATLPRIARHTAVSMPGIEGCTSSPFSISGQDLSPMTAVSSTPTYFQLGGNHALSNLNPGGAAPNMFNIASANTSTAAAAANTHAAIAGSNCFVQYVMPGQADVPVGGRVGNLLGAENRWGGL